MKTRGEGAESPKPHRRRAPFLIRKNLSVYRVKHSKYHAAFSLHPKVTYTPQELTCHLQSSSPSELNGFIPGDGCGREHTVRGNDEGPAGQHVGR